jgi:hypothetical protein
MMAGENIAAPAQPDGLERLALKLAAPRATLERDFLEMGDRLVGCAQLVGEMSSAFEDMPKAFEGEDFHATNRLFKEVADLAERIVADNRSTSAFLTEISALLKDTEQAAEAIPDLVRLVRSVASVAMAISPPSP